MLEADHHVGDLHAGVVDVVLHLDAAAGAAQQAHKRVAQRGVAQVPDVRGLIGIDVGVLDDALGALGEGASGGWPAPRIVAEKNAARSKKKLT